MTSVFPGTVDTFVNPGVGSTTPSPSHAGQHANINDSMLAVQKTVGTTAGTALFTTYTASDKPEKAGTLSFGTNTYSLGTGALGTAAPYLLYNGTTVIGGTISTGALSGRLQSIQQGTASGSSSSSSSQASLVSATVTPSATANILVHVSSSWYQSNSAASNFAGVYLNGTLQTGTTLLQTDFSAANKAVTASAFYYLTSLPVSASTISLYYNTSAGGTANVNTAYILCEVFNA